MKIKEIKKLYYSIGDVSEITGLKQYVLRYWETEFNILKPGKNKAGNRTWIKLTPLDRIAVISLSYDILPKAIKVEINIAIGTAKASIHAKLRNTYSNIRIKFKPFPRNLSILRSKKFVSNTNNKTIKAVING